MEDPKDFGEQYAYPTIEDYEKIVVYKVNDFFRSVWMMARVTNKQLGITKDEE